MKLNLGSGPDYRPGFVNVDCDANVRADVHEDILTYEPSETEPVEAVYMKHTLEHLPIDAIPGLLARIREWLVPGGTLVIDGPDLKAMCRRLAVKESWDWDDVKQIYGDQPARCRS